MKKESKKRQQNKGMTMVEVMIGFVILLMMLGMLSGTINFSHNMFQNSVDVKRATERLLEEAYKTNATAGGDKVAGSLKFKPRGDMPGTRDPITVNSEVYKVHQEYEDVVLYLYICKE